MKKKGQVEMGRKKKIVDHDGTFFPPPDKTNDHTRIDPELKEKIEGLKEEAVEEKEAEKKQRQKKKGAYTKKQERISELKGTLDGVTRLGLDFIAKRLPNPIPPSEIEISLISEAFSDVAIKHFSLFSKWSEEMALLIAISLFTIPRLIREKDESKTNIDLGKDRDRKNDISQEAD